MSISPAIYEQLLHQFPFFDKNLQTQTVSREKLRKTLSYKKAVCKLLVKLTLVQTGESQIFVSFQMRNILILSSFRLLSNEKKFNVENPGLHSGLTNVLNCLVNATLSNYVRPMMVLNLSRNI